MCNLHIIGNICCGRLWKRGNATQRYLMEILLCALLHWAVRHCDIVKNNFTAFFSFPQEHLPELAVMYICRWDCFFIRTNLETFSITLLAHQWILCSEWVPSECESKQLIKNTTIIHKYHSHALHTLSHCTSYPLFYFIICFLLHSHHICIYIYSLVFLFHSFYCFYVIFILLSCFIFLSCTFHWADLSWLTFHYLWYPVWLCMWQIIKNLEPWTLK